jgi:uncharacterized protein (TIGR00251 family)
LSYLESTAEGVVVRVRVQPRASRCEITAITEEHLKVRITAPPVEGAANRACRDYFAKQFGIAKGRVELVSGEKSRDKKILLKGIDKDTVASRVSEVVKQSK